MNANLHRIFVATDLNPAREILLPKPQSHHLLQVLRLPIHSEIILFNGQGGEYFAEIIAIKDKLASVKIKEFNELNRTPDLNIHLVYCVTRTDKMDLVLQKAAELGVASVTPILSQRGQIKLDDKRSAAKMSHWQQIMISAAEQCGRNILPALHPLESSQIFFVKTSLPKNRFICLPKASLKLVSLAIEEEILICIGPEGGFSDQEVDLALNYGFTALNLGPRVLRTETAAIAAVAAIQAKFGDML